MRYSRGDTIIEVMLAFVVFSLVVVSTIALMNKGLATAQRSLELTLVRQQIDSQVTMLDHLKHKDPAAWQGLTSAATGSQPVALSEYTACPSASDLSGSFFIATNSAKTGVQPYSLSVTNYQGARTFASVDALAKTAIPPSVQPWSYGIWVTLVYSEGFATSRAYDAHVRACWYSVGDSVPTIIATVVRIYDEN